MARGAVAGYAGAAYRMDSCAHQGVPHLSEEIIMKVPFPSNQPLRSAAWALAVALLGGCAAMAPPPDRGALHEQVMAAERAFARTMADRNAAAFATFLSSEAVFESGKDTTRGSANIAALWHRFFEKPAAPFSWYPDRVEVLDSGTLALSTGPVLDAQSRPIGRFTSIWRLESPGTWRIIFDAGCNCACERH